MCFDELCGWIDRDEAEGREGKGVFWVGGGVSVSVGRVLGERRGGGKVW